MKRSGPMLGLLLACSSCSWVDAGSSRQALAGVTKTTFQHAGVGVGPVAFTGADGQPVAERRTDPLGNPVDATDLQAHDLDAFDKRIEPATGWSDHGARWMQLQTARWLTADAPVDRPEPRLMMRPWDQNPYRQVAARPPLYLEPDPSRPLTEQRSEPVARRILRGTILEPDRRTGATDPRSRPPARVRMDESRSSSFDTVRLLRRLFDLRMRRNPLAGQSGHDLRDHLD